MDLRTQVTDRHVPPSGEQLLVQRDECAERRAGEVFDGAEVEQHVRLARLIGQGEQLVVDAVERFFIQRHLAAGEVNHGHVTGRILLHGRTFKM
jgi:hypothetical protein